MPVLLISLDEVPQVAEDWLRTYSPSGLASLWDVYRFRSLSINIARITHREWYSKRGLDTKSS